MELKRVAYGIIMAGTLILVRYIDLYIYNMPTLLAIIGLIGMMLISYKLVDRSEFFKHQISKNVYYLMNVVIVFLLFLAYYSLEL
ncbi:MAG: hypothetical protein ACE3JQ_11165 [Paenisporosarcina sp.]